MLRKGWPFILPIFVMIYLFAVLGWNAMRVGFAVILVVILISIIRSCVFQRKPISVPLKTTYRSFVNSGRSMAAIMPAACLAGIIIASVNMTAIGLRLSSGVLALAGGNLFFPVGVMRPVLLANGRRG